jgi:VAD1 Analog of StAR-related lipid transfer domain
MQSTPGVHYLVDSESISKGVPYSDAFLVATRYCIRRISNASCRLLVTFQLNFVRQFGFFESYLVSYIEKTVQSSVKETVAFLGRNFS